MMPENPISFKSLAAIQEQHRALLKERRDHPNDEAFLARAEQFIRATADAGMVFGDSVDRSALQTVLDYWVSVLYRAERDVEDVVLGDFDLSVQPELSDEDYPYIGLDSFNAQNADQFHGRKHVLDQLLSRLQKNQVLVVVGEPGTGASSLIEAGLIPLIESGALSKIGNFSVLPVVSPGADSFYSLHSVIEGEHEEALFLVIDPFDEGFRTRSSRKDRKKFIEDLKKFVSQPDASNSNRLVLVSTVAARDSIIDGTYEATEWCKDKFTNNSYRIPPMTFSDLRSVITEPARRVGLHFDEGVVEDLISDVFGEPAALPLLQFSLSRLWRFRDRNRISRQAYEQNKGGRRALGTAAEDLWNTLDTDGQEQYKYILTSLASLESTAPTAGNQSSETAGSLWRSGVQTKRLSRDVLKTGATNAESFDLVITRLIQEGLLKKIEISSTGTYDVKIAHDALFHWQRYGHWIDESRQQLSYAKQLEDMARDFRERRQLLNERTLAHAQFCRDQVGTAHLSPEVTDLIESSEKAIARSRRLRRIGFGTVIFLLVVSIISLLALRDVVEGGKESLIAIMGRAEIIDNTAQQALKNSHNEKVEQNLVNIQSTSQEISKVASEQFQMFEDRDFKAILIKPIAKNTLNRNLEITTVRQGMSVQFWGVASNASLLQLALGRSDGDVFVLDTDSDSDRLISVIGRHPDRKLQANAITIVNDVAYDSKGLFMAAGGVDGKVSVWDAKSYKLLWQCEVPDESINVARVYSIKLGYLDEKLIVAAGLDIDQAAVWEVREQCQPGDEKNPRLLEASGDVFTVDLHPDKPWLVLGSADQTISVWSLTGECDGKPESNSACILDTLLDKQGAVFSVHFDPISCASDSMQPCRLLSSTADGFLKIRELNSEGTFSEENTQTLMEDTGRQLGMARFSPDGEWVAVASQAGSVLIWSTKHTEKRPPDFTAENLGGPVFGIAFENSCGKGESCDFRLFAGTFSGRIIKMELPTDNNGE